MLRHGLVLGLLCLSLPARADDPPGKTTTAQASDPARTAAVEEPRPGKLAGRVMERGSSTILDGVTVNAAGVEPVLTDRDGRFSLLLPAGEHDLVLTSSRHEPLRVHERIVAGEQVNVEYRLLPLPGFRQRYRTVVRGEARHEGERFTLRDEELHQLPGAMGDPFRAVTSMPGVTLPVAFLPSYVVRGATPGMNGFFLDGMRVPQLFHFMVGGGVVHPQIVDRVDFYPGSYSVSIGRYAGGVIDAATRPARGDARFHGEAELRLYDVSALAETRLPKDIRIAVSGHVGYPGPIIQLFEPRADVMYWDYQLRADWKGLTLQALGSYDSVVLSGDLIRRGTDSHLPDEFRLMFHRVQLRHVYRKSRFELESAVVGGYDEMVIFGGQGVRKLGLSARLQTRWSTRKFRLLAGVDGELSQFEALNFAETGSAAAPDQMGDLFGGRNGIVAGGYVEGSLLLGDWLGRPASLSAGVRADVYHAGSVTLLGIDPRLLARVEATDWLEFHGGFGLYQQPPSFPVALPGVDTFALQLGLQRAWQASIGLRAKIPSVVSLSLTGYVERFSNINDVGLDFSPAFCSSPPPESLSGIPAQITRQLDGNAFGMEVLLRRQTGRVTGWISYTLGRADRMFSCGRRPSDFDQTHTLNLVVQVRLPWRLMAGARVYVSTGRPYTQVDPELTLDVRPVRNNMRLPTFFQVDLRIDRDWVFKSWALAVFVEALNLTYSESIFGIYYPQDERLRIPRYDQPQYLGFRWVLPSIGLRGRF